MGIDRNFHYDFSSERVVDSWEVINKENGKIRFRASFDVAEAGCNTLIFDSCHKFIDFKLDNQTYPINWENSDIAYVAKENGTGLRYAYKMNFVAGEHELELGLHSTLDEPAKEFRVTLIPKTNVAIPASQEQVFAVTTETLDVEPSSAAPDFADFIPGVGTDTCAGRFGYTKGDGLLDCAMPVLGVVDKMYLCGHPKYKKPYKWTVSVLPDGIDPARKYHGSFAPTQVGVEDDELSVNHLSVNWKTSFDAVNGFFERKAGEKVDFACTYSLASPGILVETSDPGISLSQLESAGNYQYLMMPVKDGVKCIALSEDFALNGEMSENWMLLFGAMEFPDLPILLVFEKAPTEIKIKRSITGRLAALDFYIPPKDAKMFIATPFGIESLELTTSANEEFIAEAVERCRFWSRAFMAYPIKCEEYFKLDEENEKVEIAQKFDYRFISDQWGTPPLKTAPLPPMLSMLDGTDMVDFTETQADFKFPTKYGFLKGAVGEDFVSYTLPYMPRERKFPLKDSADNEISDLLADGLYKYFNFHDQFSADKQAYPYVGSSMEPYAWAAPMFNFMDAESRRRLAKKAAERLAIANDPNRQFEYYAINFGEMMNEQPDTERVLEIYRDPELRRVKLNNYYYRKEPFTGVEYEIFYLNVCSVFRGAFKDFSREGIAAYKQPLIENDWGLGLTFYYMYLCALASGNFQPIRDNWEKLCKTYSYFEKLHDWACMGTAYCENGVSWVEGANYGAFPAFVNMAEAIGDKAAYAKSVYLAAKQLALRIGIFRSSQTYFYRFYDRSPWYITKLVHDEVNPGHAFQNVPELWDNKYHPSGVYNLSTEGLYPELFTALNKFIPKELAYVRELATQAHDHRLQLSCEWGYIQVRCSWLISAAMADDYPETRLRQDIDNAEKRGELLKEWRGIHIFSRLLPENYFKSQLLAWLKHRKHLAWLEHWVDVEITAAEYDSESANATISYTLHAQKGIIRLGVRQHPAKILLNGNELNACVKNSKLELDISESGILELFF